MQNHDGGIQAIAFLRCCVLPCPDFMLLIDILLLISASKILGSHSASAYVECFLLGGISTVLCHNSMGSAKQCVNNGFVRQEKRAVKLVGVMCIVAFRLPVRRSLKDVPRKEILLSVSLSMENVMWVPCVLNYSSSILFACKRTTHRYWICHRLY